MPSKCAPSWPTEVAVSSLPADASSTAEKVARQSYGKLVAILSCRSRDVAGAEDALSDAIAAALVDWPLNGLPRHPEAWLLATARRKLIDTMRHRQVTSAAAAHLKLLAEETRDAALEAPPVPDPRLALMFACAHPAIEPGIRAPLILQVVLGFSAQAIGSAFLVNPATIGARLSRAKNKIRAAGIPLRVPERVHLRERLAAVLEAIYGAYSSGWSDAATADGGQSKLAEEAIWLGRLVVELLPGEPEALGLLALMLYSHARRAARRDQRDEFVPLGQQDIARWDRTLIGDAESLLFEASRMRAFGRYQLEAAIQSAHVAGRLAGQTDWSAIAQLYDGLCAFTGSPVAQINRAIAIGEAQGPEHGLAALPVCTGNDHLTHYQPYWAARAALLAESGDTRQSETAYLRAIQLAADPAVRRFLDRRRREVCGGFSAP